MPTVTPQRKLWRPKMPECVQCPSCPFILGNNEEFGAVLQRLAQFPVKMDPVTITRSRLRIMEDMTKAQSGDFACHYHAYDDIAAGKLAPPEDHQQCAGATKWWQTGEFSKKAAQKSKRFRNGVPKV